MRSELRQHSGSMYDENEVAELIDAMICVMNDMGEDGHSVCAYVKAKSRIAIEPFLLDDMSGLGFHDDLEPHRPRGRDHVVVSDHIADRRGGVGSSPGPCGDMPDLEQALALVAAHDKPSSGKV